MNNPSNLHNFGSVDRILLGLVNNDNDFDEFFMLMSMMMKISATIRVGPQLQAFGLSVLDFVPPATVQHQNIVCLRYPVDTG